MTAGVHQRIEPRRFRLFFLVMLTGGLLLIGVACVGSLLIAQDKAEDQLATEMQSSTLFLEDHLSRSLDGVLARLQSVAAFTAEDASRNGKLNTKALDDLIYDDRLVRSLSLLDEQGRVLASSRADQVGLRIAAELLPTREAVASGEIALGPLLPGRDLADLAGRTDDLRADAAASAEAGGELMLAALNLEGANRGRRWVAVINPGYLRNLWARVLTRETISALLLDYRGLPLIGYREGRLDGIALGTDLRSLFEMNDKGQFDASTQPQLLVVYRASPSHPLIMALAGDRNKLRDELAPELRTYLLLAMAASGALMLLMAMQWRWYLRYEASAIEMENHSRAISSHLMVLETDPDGTIIDANAAYLGVTGYSLDELQGQNERRFRSATHSREFYNQLWNSVREGHIWQGMLNHHTREGRPYWVQATIMPYRDAWGRVVRHVSFMTDISQIVEPSGQTQEEPALKPVDGAGLAARPEPGR